MLTPSLRPLSLVPTPAYRISVLGSLAELAALRADWWALWHRVPNAMPFLSPAWVLCWARHYAPDRTRAIAVREHGVLVALLPFFNWRGALLLAGTGPSDYGGALIAPDHEALSDTLLDSLAAAAGTLGCARLDLQQLHPDSPLLSGLHSVRLGQRDPRGRFLHDFAGARRRWPGLPQRQDPPQPASGPTQSRAGRRDRHERAAEIGMARRGAHAGMAARPALAAARRVRPARRSADVRVHAFDDPGSG